MTTLLVLLCVSRCVHYVKCKRSRTLASFSGTFAVTCRAASRKKVERCA